MPTIRRIAILLALLALLWAPGAFAVVAIDSQESGGAGHNSTTAVGATSGALSWSFNNGAGNGLLVFIFLTCANSASTSPATASATYNGASMTLLSTLSFAATGGTGTEYRDWVFVFWLPGPATGSNTVAVTTTFPGNSGGSVGYDQLGFAISVSGALTLANPAVVTADDDSSLTATATVTASSVPTGALVLSGAMAGSAFSGVNAGTTESAILNASANYPGDNIIGGYTPGTGSVSPSYAVSASDHWGISAVDVTAAVNSCGGLALLHAGC